jgi:hypothetical protein
LKLAYGEGIIVAVLAPIVIFLFGKISILQTFFSVFALIGLWTLVSAYLFSTTRERMYYVSWGLIVLAISSAFVIHIQYAIALILIAIIASLLINVATRKSAPNTRDVKVDQSRSNSKSV